MSRRSKAREVALQLLYQYDLNPGLPRSAIETFARERLRDKVVEPFALGLFEGTCTHLAEIDRRLTAVAENWRLPRMAVVDRNVLRLAAYELLHAPETPGSVVLNEAVELARRFGSVKSPAFVNGLLDRLYHQARPVSPPSPSPVTPPES